MVMVFVQIRLGAYLISRDNVPGQVDVPHNIAGLGELLYLLRLPSRGIRTTQISRAVYPDSQCIIFFAVLLVSFIERSDQLQRLLWWIEWFCGCQSRVFAPCVD